MAFIRETLSIEQSRVEQMAPADHELLLWELVSSPEKPGNLVCVQILMPNDTLTQPIVNPELAAQLGIADKADPNLMEFVVEEDRNLVQQVTAAFQHEEQDNLRIHYRLRNKDGGIIFVEDKMRWVLDELGNRRFALCTLHDLTPHLGLNEILKSTENISFDVYASVGKDGKVFEISGRAEEVLGYKPEEIIGEMLTKFIHPQDVERIRESFRAAVESGVGETSNYRIMRKDGGIQWCQARGELVNENITFPFIRSIIIYADSFIQQREVNRILQSIDSPTDLNSILLQIAQAIDTMVDFDSASISLVDRENRIETSKYRFVKRDDKVIIEIVNEPKPLDSRPAMAQVISSDHPVVLPDTSMSHSWSNGNSQTRSYMGIPISGLNAVLNINRRTANAFSERDISRIQPLVSAVSLVLNNSRYIKELGELSTSDLLTGLNNRRGFFERIGLTFELAQRYYKDFSFWMADGDDFKHVNDTYGHHVGDQVLKETARRIRNGIRRVDVDCRWGGEEFAGALSETGLSGARKAAETIHILLSNTPFNTSVGDLSRTVSIGVAALDHTFRPKESLDELIIRADEALYVVKKDRKNAVGVSIPSENGNDVAVYRHDHQTNSWSIITYEPKERNVYQKRRCLRLDLEKKYNNADYEASRYSITDTTESAEEIVLGYLDFSDVHYSLGDFGDGYLQVKVLSPLDIRSIQILFPPKYKSSEITTKQQ